MSELVGTPAQVAEALETCEQKIWELIHAARIPHVWLGERKVVVPWKALDEWLTTEAACNLLQGQEVRRDPPADGDPLTYSVPEAAALLGISDWSYYEGVKRGSLPGIRLTPRRVVVPKGALDRILNDHSPGST